MLSHDYAARVGEISHRLCIKFQFDHIGGNLLLPIPFQEKMQRLFGSAIQAEKDPAYGHPVPEFVRSHYAGMDKVFQGGEPLL